MNSWWYERLISNSVQNNVTSFGKFTWDLHFQVAPPHGLFVFENISVSHTFSIDSDTGVVLDIAFRFFSFFVLSSFAKNNLPVRCGTPVLFSSSKKSLRIFFCRYIIWLHSALPLYRSWIRVDLLVCNTIQHKTSCPNVGRGRPRSPSQRLMLKKPRTNKWLILVANYKNIMKNKKYIFSKNNLTLTVTLQHSLSNSKTKLASDRV